MLKATLSQHDLRFPVMNVKRPLFADDWTDNLATYMLLPELLTYGFGFIFG